MSKTVTNLGNAAVNLTISQSGIIGYKFPNDRVITELEEVTLTEKQLCVLAGIFSGCMYYWQGAKVRFPNQPGMSANFDHWFKAAEIVEMYQGHPPRALRKSLSSPVKPTLSDNAPLKLTSQVKGLVKAAINQQLVIASKGSLAQLRLNPNMTNLKRGRLIQGSYQTYQITHKGIEYMFWRAEDGGG